MVQQRRMKRDPGDPDGPTGPAPETETVAETAAGEPGWEDLLDQFVRLMFPWPPGRG